MDQGYLEWLLGLPSLGESKARALAERFPTFEHLRAATREDVGAVPGLAPEDVDTLIRLLRPDEAPSSGGLFLCSECGSFVGSGAKACPVCGAAFGESEEAASAPPEPTPSAPSPPTLDRMYVEWLEGLPRLDREKTRKILERFPTFEHLRAATRNELAAIDGLVPVDLEALGTLLGDTAGKDESGRPFLCPECGSFTGSASKECSVCGAELSEASLAKAFGPPPGEASPDRLPLLCLHCGAFMSPKQARCGMCGRERTSGEIALIPGVDVPEEASLPFCPHCGAYLYAESEECIICGRSVSDAKAPSTKGQSKGVGRGFLTRWKRITEEGVSTDEDRLRERLEHYDHLLEADPTLERAWARRARILADLGLPRAAAESLARAAELNPSKDEEYRLEVLDLLKSEADVSYLPPRWRAPVATQAPPSGEERLLEALRHYDALLAADPSLAMAWRTRGEILGRLGRRDEAEESLGRARDLEALDDVMQRESLAGLQTAGPVRPAAGVRTTGRVNGRINGLTNGRVNGLTNGRVNGLTNGAVNGLTLGRGTTNGLVNGDGFTNGRRGRYGPARLPRQPHWTRSVVGVAAVVALMVLVPLLASLISPEPGPLGLIQIDGQFADWPASSLVGQSRRPGLDPNVDIERLGVVDNGRALAFYVAVAGQAFSGGGTPSRYDTLRLLLDTDREADTGYRVVGLGADRLVEVSGYGRRVAVTRIFEWDGNRDVHDWNGWIKATAIPAAALSQSVELEIDWDLLVAPKAPVHAYAQFQSYDSAVDEADYVLSSEGPSLVVAQEPTVAPVLAGADQELLRLHLRCYISVCAYSSITVGLTGTAGFSAASVVRIRDGVGGLLDQAIPTSAIVRFDAGPRSLAVGQSEALVVSADVTGSAGETLGASVARASDVPVAGGVVTLRQVGSARSVGYLGVVPEGTRIDGGFADWTNVSLDPSEVGRRPDVDLREYAFALNGSTASVFWKVGGRALNGTTVPAENDLVSAEARSAEADSDRDTVPDSVDPFPYDFNNDGIDDAATNEDYDGDGIGDYPTGPDWYLNTTIPSTFLPAYANRAISLYIGPSYRPVQLGEDVARVFLDADNRSSTGFRINVLGADLLVEIRGRAGVVTHRTVSVFAGPAQLAWSWDPLLVIPVATDYSRIEASFPSSELGLTNASVAYFEVMDWTRIPDGLVDPAFRIGGRGFAGPDPDGPRPSGTVRTMDLSGNEKWFFRDTTSAETVCTTNRVASTTAGATATSTTLSSGGTICWYSGAGVPDTVSGVWEVILDIDKATDGTQILSPNANGDTNAWSVDGTGCTDEANEWQCVDETTNDGDSTYVNSVSNAQTDSLYNLPDWVAPSPLSVVDVNVEASCRKTVNPAVSVSIIIKSGGSTFQGASGGQNCANSATYTVWTDTWTTDPSDSAAWTNADINALQAGVRDADSTTREVRASHVKVTVTYTPVYSVEINKCTNAGCTTTTNLYPATNFNSYGADVTIQTGTIAAQTLTGDEHIQWKITLVNGGTVTIRYNGANPGTDDSRATVPIPEVEQAIIPIVFAGFVVLVGIRWHARRTRRDERVDPSTREAVEWPPNMVRGQGSLEKIQEGVADSVPWTGSR